MSHFGQLIELAPSINKGAEEIKALAASIDALVMQATKAEVVQPQPIYNMTMPAITLTAQMPEMGQPSVTFSPVIQASDVVVQNNVQPTPIEVKAENNVTVQPANVILPALPTEAEITTDYNGKKTLRVKK